MSAIMIALLALVAIAVALYPLFKSTPRVVVTASLDTNMENLLSQREATYSAIKELEFDHAQGKLGEADYTTLRAKYETKALGILQQLQAVGKLVMQSDERLLHLPNNGCPQCGEPLGSGDKFCRSCGTALGARCSGCGAAIAIDDKFCAYCGAARATLPMAV